MMCKYWSIVCRDCELGKSRFFRFRNTEQLTDRKALERYTSCLESHCWQFTKKYIVISYHLKYICWILKLSLLCNQLVQGIEGIASNSFLLSFSLQTSHVFLSRFADVGRGLLSFVKCAGNTGQMQGTASSFSRFFDNASLLLFRFRRGLLSVLAETMSLERKWSCISSIISIVILM